MYAAGEATLEDIQNELTDRGLRTRPTQRRPAGPVSVSKIHQMLQDPYYVGIVTYKGEEYPGRHEPLIDRELFDQVQDLLASRGRAGERRRVVHHYLKGTLWCGACWRRDKSIRRMIVRRTISRSGEEYLYFFCRGTQDGFCDAKYSNVHRIERAVEEHYRTVQFSPDFLQAMRQTLDDALAEQEASQRALKEQLEGQLKRLDAQESNLLELAVDDTIPKEKIRAKLREIGTERERLTAQLQATVDTLKDAVEFIGTNLRLLEDPYELYMNASDEVRRRLNQAIFKHIFIDHDEIIDHDLEDPLGDLFTVQTIYHASTIGAPPGRLHDLAQASWAKHYQTTKKKGAAHMGDSLTSLTLEAPPNPAHRVGICSKPHLVALIDLCSSKYPTGVDTENLRRIRGSLGASRTTGADTLPDDAQTSRAVMAPRRKWKRLSNEARAQVAARYSAGETTTALAKDYGVAKSTIIAILRANNVVVRRQPLTADQVSEAARLYESGLSLSQVAAALSVNQETMRVAIIRAGVVLREPTKAKAPQPG